MSDVLGKTHSAGGSTGTKSILPFAVQCKGRIRVQRAQQLGAAVEFGISSASYRPRV